MSNSWQQEPMWVKRNEQGVAIEISETHPREKTRSQKVKITCHICDSDHTLWVDPEDFQAWQDGMLIQKAMPYLSASQRELLISSTCNKCFHEMFGVDEDA